MGLRDKVVFLAARGRAVPRRRWSSSPSSPFVDMIIAAQAADRHRVDRCRRLEVRPALHQRHPADGQQHARGCRQVRSSGRTTATSRTICGPRASCRASGPRRRHRRRDRRCRWCCCSRRTRTVTWLAVVGMVAFHLFIISTFPLAVPLEWNVLFMFATVFLFLRLPGRGRLRRRRHVLTVAACCRSSRRCCSSRSSATCGRTWCRSCRRCGSTPATGHRRCGRSRATRRRTS